MATGVGPSLCCQVQRARESGACRKWLTIWPRQRKAQVPAFSRHYQIDNVGNVKIERAKLFVHHTFLVSQIARKGKVTVTIIRGGRLHTLESVAVPSSEADMLVCPYLANGTP